jgi:hypothetical protein
VFDTAAASVADAVAPDRKACEKNRKAIERALK